MTQYKRPRHGLRYHPLYGRWLGMSQRCNDPAHVRYADYGGKGVTVCERWRSFPNFLEDMGMPADGMSIERIDGNKGYEPGNCVWATTAQQSRNKSSNRFYELNGKSQCMTDWAKELGISPTTLSERLSKWPLERALTTAKLPNQGPRK
jgi:hypothetical protein